MIYLDHNATTFLKPAVAAAMQEIQRFPGNASSVHKGGRDSRRKIEDSRQTVISQLNLRPKDVVIFTSGATEANNQALLGSGAERMIISAIEHPSVLNAAAKAEILPVLNDGRVDLQALEKMLHGNTQQTLISVMLVNNETGVIQPIEDITRLARQYGAIVHTDAVQAMGRIPVDIQKLNVDFLTLSAHKIGGPQGVGCLIAANCMPIAPMFKGGNQEKNLRAGTENLAGIVGFATALKECDHAAFTQHLQPLRDALEKTISDIAPNVTIFGQTAPRVVNTSLFACPNMPSDMQLIALDLAGICVSNGSACSSGTVKPSHVLKAMGIDDKIASTVLRVSMGWNTTRQDIEGFIKVWTELNARAKK